MGGLKSGRLPLSQLWARRRCFLSVSSISTSLAFLLPQTDGQRFCLFCFESGGGGAIDSSHGDVIIIWVCATVMMMIGCVLCIVYCVCVSK